MRLVDDFLMVSYLQGPIHNFLDMLGKSDNPYGGELNLSKCVTNFCIRGEPARASLATAPLEIGPVPWAGLALSPEEGFVNVSAQGSRAGACVAEALALRRRSGRPGRHLCSPWRAAVDSKLHRFLDLKLTPFLLDPSLNSTGCALANVARICGLCGMRLAWLVLRRCPQLDVPPDTVAVEAVRLARHATRLATRLCFHSSGIDQLEPRHFACADLEMHCLEAFQASLHPWRSRSSLCRAYQLLGVERMRTARRCLAVGLASQVAV